MIKKILFFILFLGMLKKGFTQSNLLQQKVSINASKQKLSDVLQKISAAGNFYFSYNSKIIKGDSVVSFNCSNMPVNEALEKLFNHTIDYKASGRYVILHKRVTPPLPPQASITTYTIKGFVKDESTGVGVANASIYEKTKLASALSDGNGYFVMKIKTKSPRPLLFVSKENYYDTSIAVALPAIESVNVLIQNMYRPVIDTATITIISPTDTVPVIIPDSTIRITQAEKPPVDTTLVAEKTGWAKFVLSTRQRIQAINLSKFYTTRIYQLSLVPGLSTHGKLSSQVENIISINAIGGYTGGTAAFEAGGVFNINRKNTAYLQAAGVFNVTGGNMKGLQAAGVHNHVLGRATGLQAGGVSNFSSQSFTGLQVAGVYNHADDSLQGAQISGVANYTAQKTKGIQIAGVGNIVKGSMNGVQVAGVFNYAKTMNGLQIGLINISDSSNGYSVGLINFVRSGMHQLSFSTNEITNTNIAFKTGNPKLYSILHAGYNFSDSNKVFSYGYGVGTVINPGRKITVQPELLSRYLYTGSWSNSNILNSLYLNLQANISNKFAVYAAPVVNFYFSTQTSGVKDYRFPVKPVGYPSLIQQDKFTAWIGFSVGLSIL